MHFKQHNLSFAVLFALAISVFLSASCHRPGPDPKPPIDTQAAGIYVLNEGLFQMNNSTLSYYDLSTGTLTDDIFLQTNQRGLGDVGNDLKSYGAKLYAVINNSNRVEIMDLGTAKSLRSISLPNKQPRCICFHGGKAYISCFDGDVVRIDTASLEVDATVHSGPNPDGICVCNGKLYVANSGGLNYPNYNNTVSVFDLNNFTLTKTITVETNPSLLNSYDNRYVYLVSHGDYAGTPSNFQKIDASTDQVVKTFNIEVSNFTIYDHFAYFYNFDYVNTNPHIVVMDLQKDEIVKENFISDGTVIQAPYGISVNPLNGDVYVSDAFDFTVTGEVFCFDQNGKKKFSFESGLNPNKLVFKN